MDKYPSWRRMLGMLLAVIALIVSPSVVLAHAEYKSSVPAANATVDTAPAKVVIVFSEELQAQGNTIVVKDATGATVDQGDTSIDKSDADRATVTVSLKPNLSSGMYRVTWKNTSSDGHSESGSFTFTVGVPTPANLPQTGGDALLPMLALIAAAVGLWVGWQIRRRIVQ